MAVPITSARSVAMIAPSASTHSGTDIHLGKASRQACARSRPEATASRAHSDWSRIAMMFDSRATNKSV